MRVPLVLPEIGEKGGKWIFLPFCSRRHTVGKKIRQVGGVGARREAPYLSPSLPLKKVGEVSDIWDFCRKLGGLLVDCASVLTFFGHHSRTTDASRDGTVTQADFQSCGT